VSTITRADDMVLVTDGHYHELRRVATTDGRPRTVCGCPPRGALVARDAVREQALCASCARLIGLSTGRSEQRAS